VSIAGFSALVHAVAPHTKLEFFTCYALCSALAIALVYLRCCYTGSEKQLQGAWLVKTAAAAAPIPVYVLLPLSPFDPDLAAALLEEQVILGLAGLYGLIETIKDIRGTAGEARGRAQLQGNVGAEGPSRSKRWLVYVVVVFVIAGLGLYGCVIS
jgi:hypothetical protein